LNYIPNELLVLLLNLWVKNTVRKKKKRRRIGRTHRLRSRERRVIAGSLNLKIHQEDEEVKRSRGRRSAVGANISVITEKGINH
jgi:hypothetical protein